LIRPAILFLGLEDMMKVTIVAPRLIQHETARSFRTGRQRAIWAVFVPAVTPSIVTGLRLNLGSVLVTTVVAEMIADSTGAGASANVTLSPFAKPATASCGG
jgi:ABC-type nitrate/sulfonate/bicarbonate transport system permease component